MLSVVLTTVILQYITVGTKEGDLALTYNASLLPHNRPATNKTTSLAAGRATFTVCVSPGCSAMITLFQTLSTSGQCESPQQHTEFSHKIYRTILYVKGR